MDWSKAKTILIIALLITNLFLFAFSNVNKREIDKSLNQISFSKTKELLERKNIELNEEIKSPINDIYRVDVEYQLYKPSDMNRYFFDGKGIREHSDEAIVEIFRGEENVTIINEKYLIYTNGAKLIDKGIYDLESAKNEALRFMEEKGFNELEDLYLTYFRKTNEGFYLEYTKMFNNAFLENTFTTFRIESGGVRRFERTWLNIKQAELVSLKPIEPEKALLELLSKEEVYGKKIESVDLCYYFNPEKQDYLEEYLGATQGRSVLAWRVQFSDGYKVILDFD